MGKQRLNGLYMLGGGLQLMFANIKRIAGFALFGALGRHRSGPE